MLEEGSEAGVIEQQERDMVRNVFRLDDRQIGSLMIPRADITYLDTESPLEENLRRIEAAGAITDAGADGNYALCTPNTEIQITGISD